MSSGTDRITDTSPGVTGSELCRGCRIAGRRLLRFTIKAKLPEVAVIEETGG